MCNNITVPVTKGSLWARVNVVCYMVKHRIWVIIIRSMCLRAHTDTKGHKDRPRNKSQIVTLSTSGDLLLFTLNEIKEKCASKWDTIECVLKNVQSRFNVFLWFIHSGAKVMNNYRRERSKKKNAYLRGHH